MGNNYSLKQFTTPHNNYVCDGCNKVILKGDLMFGCRDCNYDLCQKCIKSKDKSKYQLIHELQHEKTDQQKKPDFLKTKKKEKPKPKPKSIPKPKSKPKSKPKPQPKSKPQPQPKLITCNVCMEQFPTNELSCPTSKCTHKAETCNECLRGHIAEEVNGKGITRQINCPHPDCGKTLEHHEIQKICMGSQHGRLTFQRFDNLLFRRTVESMPEFLWCSGENCGSGQIHVGGTDTPIMRCNGCNHKTCAVHKVSYHDGLSCTEYDASIAKAEAEAGSEALQQAWKDRMTKPCPNCETPIEKNEGCCHMTCANKQANCKHEFCWHCSAPWKEGMLGRRGAHYHEKTCSRYAPKE
jgi:hypothetical protein